MIDLFASKVFVPPAYRDLPAAEQPRIRYRQASAAEVLRWQNADQAVARAARDRLRAGADEDVRDLVGRLVTLRADGLPEGHEVHFSVVSMAGEGIDTLTAIADEDGRAITAWSPAVDEGNQLHDDETIAHHLDLALACVQKIEGISAGGIELDWKNGAKLCEVFGVADARSARETILLSLGSGFEGLNCLIDLANACATGLTKSEKKDSSESSSSGGST